MPGPLQKFIANRIIKNRLSEVKERYAEIEENLSPNAIDLETSKKLAKLCENIKNETYEVVCITPHFRYSAPKS